MKEWMKVRTNKALFVLAAVSFAVITAWGILYYASYPDAFFRFLLILQNTIKAFTFMGNRLLSSWGEWAYLISTVERSQGS